MNTATTSAKPRVHGAKERRRKLVAALRRAHKTPEQIGRLLFCQLLEQNPEKALRMLREQ